MTNDQFLLFPMLSYGYKNTVGAVAHLFFSDPPFAPHANEVWNYPEDECRICIDNSVLYLVVVQQLYPGVDDNSTVGVSVRSIVRVTEISELLRSRPAV